MGELVHWFFDDGAKLIESLGVVVGLFFTGFALRADMRSRRADILIRMTESHRNLWIFFDTHPELKRIFDLHADLKTQPLTAKEQRFVQFMINHIVVSFRTTRLGIYVEPEKLEMDLAEFFSLPVPRAVWEKLRRFQDRDFALFMDESIGERFSKDSRIAPP